MSQTDVFFNCLPNAPQTCPSCGGAGRVVAPLPWPHPTCSLCIFHVEAVLGRVNVYRLGRQTAMVLGSHSPTYELHDLEQVHFSEPWCPLLYNGSDGRTCVGQQRAEFHDLNL